MTTYIYALIDPRDRSIRYIGKSVAPTSRAYVHVSQAKTGKKSWRCHWIRQLLAAGLKPELFVIEECEGDGCAEECFHIRLGRQDGLRLTNATDGGEGMPGYKASAETRKKLSVAMTEWCKDPAVRAAKSVAMRGRQFTAEHKAKIGEKSRGRSLSPESRRKLAASHTGKVHSTEVRQKLSAMKRGRRHSAEHVAKRMARTVASRYGWEWSPGAKNPSLPVGPVVKRVCRGEQSHLAKLTANDVLRVRELQQSGVRDSVIAREYRVSQGQIYNIKMGLAWRHLTGISPA